MARIIGCPKEHPITVTLVAKDGSTQEVKYPFKDVLMFCMDTYQPAGKGLPNIRRSVSITNKIGEMDGSISLDEEEYKLLKEAVSHSEWQPAKLGRILMPYFDAVENTQQVPELEKNA